MYTDNRKGNPRASVTNRKGTEPTAAEDSSPREINILRSDARTEANPMGVRPLQ